MKYRVIEVFDTEIVPWFRLQKSPDGNAWEFVTSGGNKDHLVQTMQRIAEEKPPVTVAEIES